jgi:hypothetical protein
MLARVIFLPVYPELRDDEVDALVDAVKRVEPARVTRQRRSGRARA